MIDGFIFFTDNFFKLGLTVILVLQIYRLAS